MPSEFDDATDGAEEEMITPTGIVTYDDPINPNADEAPYVSEANVNGPGDNAGNLEDATQESQTGSLTDTQGNTPKPEAPPGVVPLGKGANSSDDSSEDSGEDSSSKSSAKGKKS